MARVEQHVLKSPVTQQKLYIGTAREKVTLHNMTAPQHCFVYAYRTCHVVT